MSSTSYARPPPALGSGCQPAADQTNTVASSKNPPSERRPSRCVAAAVGSSGATPPTERSSGGVGVAGSGVASERRKFCVRSLMLFTNARLKSSLRASVNPRTYEAASSRARSGGALSGTLGTFTAQKAGSPRRPSTTTGSPSMRMFQLRSSAVSTSLTWVESGL